MTYLRIAMVALLALIWVELGGIDSARHWAHYGVRALQDMFYRSKEEPAPSASPGGLDFDGTAQVQFMADQASAAGR